MFLGDMIQLGALAGYQIAKQASTNYIDVDIKVTWEELEYIINMPAEGLGLDLSSLLPFYAWYVVQTRMYLKLLGKLVAVILAFWFLFFAPTFIKELFVNGWMHTFREYRDVFSPYMVDPSDIPHFKLRVLLFSLFTLWIVRRVRSHSFYLRLRLDSAARSEMKEAKNRATQQMTGNGVASQPIITQVNQTTKMKYKQMGTDLWTMYNAVLCWAASTTCDGDCWNVATNRQFEQDDPEEEEDDRTFHETIWDLQDDLQLRSGNEMSFLDIEKKAAEWHRSAYNYAQAYIEREKINATKGRKEVITTRKPTHPEKPIRRGVRAKDKSWIQLFFDRERGEKRIMPGDDDVPTDISGLIVGVNVCNVTAAYAQCPESEYSGLQRHYGKVLHPITKAELGYTRRQLRYMRIVGREVCKILTDALLTAGPEVIQTKFPAKWKDMTVEDCLETMAKDQGQFVYDLIKGFIKREPGQPEDKNARLITNPGVKACARLLSMASTLEEVMKLKFPHLGGSGLTQDEQDARIADFLTHAAKFGLQVFSGDFKSFDGTQTKTDREIVNRDIIHKAYKDSIAEFAERLNADLGEEDFVLKHGMDRKKIEITYHYMKVVVDVLVAILFSGERLTSLGNRLLVLVVDGADLMREACDRLGEEKGIEEGLEIVRDMFYCPEELENTLKPKDEKGHGRNYESTHLDINNYDPEESPYVKKMGRRNFSNWGGGDDVLFVRPFGFYKDERELIDRFADMHKLMDLCSHFKERRDGEVLSRYVIWVKGEDGKMKPRFLPKAPKVFMRLVFSKIKMTGPMYLKNGVYSAELSHDDWRQLATEYWQRSYALKHTPIVRHLCRAMFEYALSKAIETRSWYVTVQNKWAVPSKYDDEDADRLGLIQGDVDLCEMIDIVYQNTTLMEVSSYPLVKSLHFKTYSDMKYSARKQLNIAVANTDERWSTMVLNDDLIESPEEFQRLYPMSEELAPSFNYRTELLFLEKDELGRLAKGEKDPAPSVEETPEVSRSPRAQASSTEGDSVGDSDFRACCGIMVVDEKGRLLTGVEKGKRVGMVSIPWGKCDPKDFKQGTAFYKATAIRELYEETGYTVNSRDIRLVKCWNYKGKDPDEGGNRCFLLYVEAKDPKTGKELLFIDENKPQLTDDECDLADVRFRSPDEIRAEFGNAKISDNVMACINRRGREMSKEKYKLYEYPGKTYFEKFNNPERIEIFGWSNSLGRKERKCKYAIPHVILSENWQPKVLYGKPMEDPRSSSSKDGAQVEHDWAPSLDRGGELAPSTTSSSPEAPQEGVPPRADTTNGPGDGRSAAPSEGGLQSMCTDSSLRPAEPSVRARSPTGIPAVRRGGLATGRVSNRTLVGVVPDDGAGVGATDEPIEPSSPRPMSERSDGQDSSDFSLPFPSGPEESPGEVENGPDTSYDESLELTLRLVEIQRRTRFPRPPFNPSQHYPLLKSCVSMVRTTASAIVDSTVAATTSSVMAARYRYGRIDSTYPHAADLQEVIVEGDVTVLEDSTSSSPAISSSPPIDLAAEFGFKLKSARLEPSVEDKAHAGLLRSGREPGCAPDLPPPTTEVESDIMLPDHLLETLPTPVDAPPEMDNKLTQEEAPSASTGNSLATTTSDLDKEERAVGSVEDENDGPVLPPVSEDTELVLIENVWIAEPRPPELTYDILMYSDSSRGYVMSPLYDAAIRYLETVKGGYIVKAIMRYHLTLSYRTYEHNGQWIYKVHVGLRIGSITGFEFHDEDDEPIKDAHGNDHHITLFNGYRSTRWCDEENDWVPYVEWGSVEWAVKALLEQEAHSVEDDGEGTVIHTTLRAQEQFVYLCKWTPPDYEGEKQLPLLCVKLTQDVVFQAPVWCNWANRRYEQEILIADKTGTGYHVSCHEGFDFRNCAEVTNEMWDFWKDFCNGVFHPQLGHWTDIEPEIPDQVWGRQPYWRPVIRWANSMISQGLIDSTVASGWGAGTPPFEVPVKDLYYGLDTWGVTPH